MCAINQLVSGGDDGKVGNSRICVFGYQGKGKISCSLTYLGKAL